MFFLKKKMIENKIESLDLNERIILAELLLKSFCDEEAQIDKNNIPSIKLIISVLKKYIYNLKDISKKIESYEMLKIYSLLDDKAKEKILYNFCEEVKKENSVKELKYKI